MKKFDVVAIGELNTDIILNKIDGFPQVGKEKFAKDMTLTLGSSTAIFAANIAALGVKTAFVGMIGNDVFGKLIKNSLAEKSVYTNFLIQSDKYPTGATIVLNYGEDRANITFQGAMDFMTFDDIDKKIFQKTKHIHISSIFMQSGLKKDLLKILKFASENGVRTSLDTQWDPSEKWDLDYKTILPYVSVFMPNEKELQLLTGSSDLNTAIEKILPFINVCIIKCGKNGSILVQKDGTQHYQEAFLNENVVDAIGAGDSFNSGFIYQFIKGQSLTECQRFGNLIGAINTTASGGTSAFTSKENIEQIAKEKFKQSISL
ncbi:MAG: carbohydrate kinase family protein [Bacteroidales bacterium]|jgi:sugar/nucleoside kinase (ribokinase family)|nr:carbohydrate kinase family protein [Bacteroidales bacterium]HOV83993.1 carbohydrate kinase family protein [Paludibacteraceae bacterium]